MEIIFGLEALNMTHSFVNLNVIVLKLYVLPPVISVATVTEKNLYAEAADWFKMLLSSFIFKSNIGHSNRSRDKLCIFFNHANIYVTVCFALFKSQPADLVTGTHGINHSQHALPSQDFHSTLNKGDYMETLSQLC